MGSFFWLFGNGCAIMCVEGYMGKNSLVVLVILAIGNIAWASYEFVKMALERRSRVDVSKIAYDVARAIWDQKRSNQVGQ